MLAFTPMTAPTDPMLTLEELAIYLKLSKSTLYKLVQRGEVPGTKIGKHWRFRRETIDQWIDSDKGRNKQADKD